MARLLMENAVWAFFESFIRGIRVRGSRPGSYHRLVVDGVLWIARTGAQWNDPPGEFGKWSSVYRPFRRWTVSGLWNMTFDALNESEAMPDQVQMIRWPKGDSTIIRAHHPLPGRTLRRQWSEREAAGVKAFSVNGCNHVPVSRGLCDKILAAQTPLVDAKITCRVAGGTTTNIYLIATAHGLPMKAEISCGEISDYRGFDQMRADPLPAPNEFIADKGYD